jgi:deoxycytidylate deaminase
VPTITIKLNFNTKKAEQMTPQQTDELYMNIALQYAKYSKAQRKKVGACLVTSNGVVLGG